MITPFTVFKPNPSGRVQLSLQRALVDSGNVAQTNQAISFSAGLIKQHAVCFLFPDGAEVDPPRTMDAEDHSTKLSVCLAKRRRRRWKLVVEKIVICTKGGINVLFELVHCSYGYFRFCRHFQRSFKELFHTCQRRRSTLNVCNLSSMEKHSAIRGRVKGSC